MDQYAMYEETSPGLTSRDRVKRSYRACLHCRSRKAKCDLGDIDAPSSPPCSRCRRESRECVFAPSRRGGNNIRRKKDESESDTSLPGPSTVKADHLSPYRPLQSPFPSTTFPRPSPTNSHSPAFSTHSPNSPKRRRLHLNPPLHAADPSSIVVADMQNESDALHILALASDKQPENPPTNGRPKSVKPLKDFPLIQLGVVTEPQVLRLSEVFFRCHHHLYPMVPSAIIPRTPDQVAVFATNERYLLTAIIIIASRNDLTLRDVHDKSWAVFRGWLSDIQCLGAPPTVGLVEGLLLLAENLPRDPVRKSDPNLHAVGFGEDVHGAENRQAWMLIGAAIRNAYGLGLEKLALKLIPESERTIEVERARLAWTYCYLFDRHVSLRLGLAFWSRGPTVCFQGFSSSAQTGPPAGARNFPFLREIRPDEAEHPQEDLAGLLQAYVELTQLMSNAHDVLYPNAARTRSLVMYGEYFKYIDELARSLDGFKILWRDKKWNIFPLTDTMWTMFYYVQLYICAFSFQAHVERAAMRAEEENQDQDRPALSLFPRGAAASPDARYIFQSCDAARTLLHICVDSLSPGGALPFLPSRYLLWFTYAAIVLLKALYSGAMLRADHAETLKLIDRLCACLAAASPDEDHPTVRYGRQLAELSKKLAGQDTSAPVTPPLPWIPQPTPPTWNLPVAPQEPHHMPFAYNLPMPPNQQPMSDMNIEPLGTNSLGFVQLDDWFNTGVEGDGFGALDLQDFWMKVGPGEAQGGFPFR